MTNRNLITLAATAVVLGAAAYLANTRVTPSRAPRLNGQVVLPDLDVSAVASVELGDRLKLSSGPDGWTAPTYHNYPLDRAKVADALLKLTELKVGQVVRGKTLEGTTDLVLRGTDGAELARLTLGERHAKWGHGRYAAFKGETVLVSDTLDAFDGEGKGLIETKIVDTPYVSFSDIVEGLSEEELGFATGVVAKVTIGGDTNRTVTVGNKAKDGSDRYLKLDRGDWIFKVPSYAVESLLPKPPPEEKPEDKPSEVPSAADPESHPGVIVSEPVEVKFPSSEAK